MDNYRDGFNAACFLPENAAVPGPAVNQLQLVRGTGPADWSISYYNTVGSPWNFYGCVVGGVQYLATGTIPLDEHRYYHIATTWDGTTLTHYVDGVQDAAIVAPGTLRTNVSGMGINYYFGMSWNGAYAMLRTYGRILSSAEIGRDKLGYVLVGANHYLPCQEGRGSLVRDIIGGANGNAPNGLDWNLEGPLASGFTVNNNVPTYVLTPDLLTDAGPWTMTYWYRPNQFPDVPPLGPIPPSAGWAEASEWGSCSLQLFYAQILKWMYVPDVGKITTAFRMLLGNGVTVTWHPGSSWFTDVVTVVGPDYSVAVSDGTMNFQQFATQGFYGLYNPQDYGAYGTLPLWQQAAQRIATFLAADGADPTKPVMLVGHSYGAAAMEVLSAIFRLAQPGRAIRYLTFASPKPGDIRLRRVLTTVQEGFAICNYDDVICSLPPDLLSLTPVEAVLALAGMRNWSNWYRDPHANTMQADGTLEGLPPLVNYDVLYGFTSDIIASLPLPAIPAHGIAVYRDRIYNRCPNAEWPVSPALLVFLNT